MVGVEERVEAAMSPNLPRATPGPLLPTPSPAYLCLTQTSLSGILSPEHLPTELSGYPSECGGKHWRRLGDPIPILTLSGCGLLSFSGPWVKHSRRVGEAALQTKQLYLFGWFFGFGF